MLDFTISRSKENTDTVVEQSHSSTKKKHKKEKRKHKKHSSEKPEKDKTRKHKKHKKSKHKDNEEKSQKNGDYTPEKKESPAVPNGKTSVEKLDAEAVSDVLEMEKKKADTASSESDVQDADCDSVDIDLDLIEADMDLEELMKQKELLQAQLAKAESEGVISPQATKEEKVSEEVILLDDSDEHDAAVPERTKRKRSRSRERKISIRATEESKRRKTHSRERLFREHERDRQIRKFCK